MIEVFELTKRFGRKVAVDGLSFRIEAGEVVGFLGRNGAGKTTTMRILAGCLPASGGSARVAGADVFLNSLGVRERVGYLPENAPVCGDLRVAEYLRFRGRLKGLHGRNLRNRVAAVTECCGLAAESRTLIRRLSKGYRQRVGLADTLLHHPPVILLDEPTIGLDPNQIRHVRDLLAGLAKQHTVLISTHILQEVELLCNRVLILDRGRIVASDTPQGLRSTLQGGVHVRAEIRGPQPDVLATLRSFPGVAELTGTAMDEWINVTCVCREGCDVREDIFDAAVRNNWKLRDLSAVHRRLEEVFAALTLGTPHPPDQVERTPPDEGSHA